MKPTENVEILYENADLLVIGKPTDLSVTKDRSGRPGLREWIEEHMPHREIRLVHRLDKQTSGVMLLSKNLETQRILSQAFEKGDIHKTYLALVTGYVPNSRGRINRPLAPDRKSPQLMKVDSQRGKPAVTDYRMLADFGHAALLAVFPQTGRTHQIRIHFSHAGMPLAIDPLYGADRPLYLSDFKTNYRSGKNKTETPLIERLTLHAYQIQIPPLGDAPTTFVAPLDKKFAATIKMLTKHNPRGPEAFPDNDTYNAILSAQPLP